jgi:hypothetical protein
VRYRDPVDFKKPVETIAIIPKSGPLTYFQKKLFNTLLAHAQQMQRDAPEQNADSFSMPLSTVTANVDFDSNNTEFLKEQFRRMVTTVVEWNSPGKSWETSGLIGSAGLFKADDGRVILNWSYPPPVRRDLLRPDVYTRLSLAMIGVWRSGSASTLYEICMRYRTNHEGLTNRAPWDWWESVLCGKPRHVDGAKEYKYFKRDTLKPAMAEVNRLQDEIEVELVEYKQGRRISEIQFKVSPKAQPDLGLNAAVPANLFDSNLHGRLMSVFKIDASAAMQFFSTYDEDRIRAALTMTERRMQNRKAGALSSPIAYFKDALKKNYASQSKKPALAAPAKTAAAASMEDLLPSIREAYARKQRADAEAMFNEQTEVAKADALKRYDEDAAADMALPILKAWKSGGLNNKMAASHFFTWLAKVTWPNEPTERELLSFAIESGLLKAR